MLAALLILLLLANGLLLRLYRGTERGVSATVVKETLRSGSTGLLLAGSATRRMLPHLPWC